MNYLKFVCPKCQQSLEAPSDMAGQKIDCPTCKTTIEVPVSIRDPNNNLSQFLVTPQSSVQASKAPALKNQSFNSGTTQKTSGFAIASLVMGILGFLFGWAFCGIIFPILAIVFGHVAHSQIKKQPVALIGRNMAITGFILGYIGIVISLVVKSLLTLYFVFCH